MTRAVVVDDHPVFRRGLVALLRSSGIEVAAEATSGEEAVEVAARERPDVVLMDLGLPGMGGIAATARIVATDPDVRVLVITQYDDEDSVRAALAAGATGYVLKLASPEQILAATAAVQMGAMWVGSDVPRPGADAPERAASSMFAFTPREAAVADLIGRGLTNPAIAARLGLSAKTVANYVSSVLRKVDAPDRIAAAVIIRMASDPTAF